MFENINTLAEALRRENATSLLSKKQAAKELNISTETIDRLRKKGEIKSQMVGQTVKFNVFEVARVIIGD